MTRNLGQELFGVQKSLADAEKESARQSAGLEEKDKTISRLASERDSISDAVARTENQMKETKNDLLRTQENLSLISQLMDQLTKEKRILESQLEEQGSKRHGDVEREFQRLKNSLQESLQRQEILTMELTTKNKQVEGIQDQLARISSLYSELSTEKTYQENSIGIFNIYVTLVEKVWSGNLLGKILFLLHSPKEIWTKTDLAKATGSGNIVILRSLHELARAGIVLWDEVAESAKLVQRFL